MSALLFACSAADDDAVAQAAGPLLAQGECTNREVKPSLATACRAAALGSGRSRYNFLRLNTAEGVTEPKILWIEKTADYAVYLGTPSATVRLEQLDPATIKCEGSLLITDCEGALPSSSPGPIAATCTREVSPAIASKLEAGDCSELRRVNLYRLEGPAFYQFEITPPDGRSWVRALVTSAGLDTDGDGVKDLDDSCPNEPNADQRDTDADGIGDACECIAKECPCSTCDSRTGGCTGAATSEGAACSPPSGARAAACRDGQCAPLSCEPDRADCDGDSSNGCETYLMSSPGHCGGCDQSCPAGDACSRGTCEAVPHSIATGRYGFNCMLPGDGTVLCRGVNAHGELGNGRKEDSTDYVAVLGINDATAVAAGTGHACALRQGGRVSCWGGGSVHGTLGDGRGASSRVPVDVVDLPPVRVLEAGDWSTCAIDDTGGLWCWGDLGPWPQGVGQDIRWRPHQTPLRDVVAFDAGLHHGCAVLGSGQVACWFRNGGASDRYGVLGKGRATGDFDDPRIIDGVSDAIDVAISTNRTCSLNPAGEVKCWGKHNTTDQFGRPQVSSGAFSLPELGPAIAIEGSWAGHCSITTSNQIRCRWENDKDDAPPVLDDVVTLAFGFGFDFCQMARDGRVSCCKLDNATKEWVCE